MFCPKCGIKNPDTGKFCRGCGTDLATVSEALTGKLSIKDQGSEMTHPAQAVQVRDSENRPASLESAVRRFFIGIAFLIISIILGVTSMGSAGKWWFWLLIPAFALIGTGIAQYIQWQKNEQRHALNSQPQRAKAFNQTPNETLPPAQTEYVKPQKSIFDTGEFAAPPSVIENTTRHLEIDNEGETMTLPEK